MGVKNDKSLQQRWLRAFRTWAKKTTLDGVRKLTKQYSPFLIQRLIWAGFVVAAFVFMFREVSDCITLYYSRPLAVDIKVTSRKTVEFPALTICNINRFRTTGMDKTGFYKFWQEYYEPEYVFDVNNYLPENENSDIKELFSTWAHQKEDMIYSCSWDGGTNNCGPENFTTVYTRYGKCYTFNSDADHKLMSSMTGSNYGLKLTINVEQYEYTRGPENTAGIKFLVHPPEEPPRMSEMGSFLGVGFEALLAIQHGERISTGDPYGNCTSKPLKYFQKYTAATCDMECFIDNVVKTCGCRDVYMPEISAGKPRVCKLEPWINCAMPSVERYYNSPHYCPCSENCHIDVYTTSLSSAPISKLNTETIANLKFEGVEAVQQKLKEAKNVYDKENMKKSAEDRSMLKKLLEEMIQIQYKLDSMINETQGIQDDAKAIIDDVYATAHTYTFVLQNFSDYYSVNISERQIDKEMAKVYQGFAFDRAYFLESLPTNFKLFWRYYKDYFLTEDEVSKFFLKMQAEAALNDIRVDMLTVNGSLKISSVSLNKIYVAVFDELELGFPTLEISGIYDYNLVTLELFIRGDTCVTEIQKSLQPFLKQVFRNDTFEVEDNGNVLKKSVEILLDDVIQKQEECMGYFRRLIARFKMWYIPQLLKAHSIEPFTENVLSLDRATDNIMKPLQKTKRELNRALIDSRIINEKMVSWVDTYLQSQGTKYDLVSNMTEYRIAHYGDEIEFVMARFTGGLDSLSFYYNDFVKVVKNTFRFIADDIFLEKYEKMPMRVSFSLERMEELEAAVVKQAEEFHQLALIWPDKIVEIFEESSAAFYRVMKDMWKFDAEVRIDEIFYQENFLQLNMYFSDFKKESIIQIPGYDFNTLIAAVGGNLGLFVGASLFTGIEILNVIGTLISETFVKIDDTEEKNPPFLINVDSKEGSLYNKDSGLSSPVRFRSNHANGQQNGDPEK